MFDGTRGRPSRTRRWLTTATWPVGVAMTSWDYMWRSTPLHRHEAMCAPPSGNHSMLTYPAVVSAEDVQGQERGHGPLFHRRYRTRIRSSDRSAQELMGTLIRDLNQAAPTAFARFHKVLGDEGKMAVGDEYVVRMPGPWDGPVRVIDFTDSSFRLATLAGHLEAGQIEFRVREVEHDQLRFEIESWARSSNWLSNLLYHHLRMAKEIQAHMWISFLEGVVAIAGGKMTGGVEIDTERTEDHAGVR
jgi:Domain of unknown function (DUF1990)